MTWSFQGIPGDRGKSGDHGQAGADGRPGLAGPTGERGPVGRDGPPGAVLSKKQALVGFGFVVLAFFVMAYVVQETGSRIEDSVQRQDQLVTEVCARQPDLAPATCSLPR